MGGTYGYIEAKRAWYVTHNGDAGLAAVMEVAGASVAEARHGAEVRRYWVVRPEAWGGVREILDDMGYVCHGGDDGRSARTYTVSEVNARIGLVIKEAFEGRIWLRGEVSEYTVRGSGHAYLNLIDRERYTAEGVTVPVRAIIWASALERINAKLAANGMSKIGDGIEVRVYGGISYYERGGSVSFVITDIDAHFGEGEFFKKKALIEARLVELGLHGRNKSLPFPEMPLRIALFSNATAAGYRDFMRTLEESGYPFRVTLFEVSLQGDGVAGSFARAFEMLGRIGEDGFDLGIIVRGGGSLLELSYFNDFDVACLVARSPLKFLIAIGHDKDRCVLDEIAGNARTPSAVGDMIVSQLDARAAELDDIVESAINASERRIEGEVYALVGLAAGCAREARGRLAAEERALDGLVFGIKSVADGMQGRRHSELGTLESGLMLAATGVMSRESLVLSGLEGELRAGYGLAEQRAAISLDGMGMEISAAVSAVMGLAEAELGELSGKLRLLDPRVIMDRGFAIVCGADGRRLSGAADAAPGDRIAVHMSDGRIEADVVGIRGDR